MTPLSHTRALLLAAGLIVAPLAGAAQQVDAIGNIGALVNQGFGAVSALRADIFDAERRLNELESALTVASPGVGRGEPSQLATEIARHPLVLTAKPLCKDAFQELVVENVPARVDVIDRCIDDISPRIRYRTALECATLHWVLSGDGQLRLNGYVQGEEDRAQLASTYGAQTVASVTAKPFPACAALEALELPLTSNAKPGVRLLSDKTRVAFKESLAFEVTTPDFFAFVYVVYLQADGSVVNLTPRTRLLREQYRPRSTILFGDGVAGRQLYTASAPAGSEAIIVVTSRSPIDSLDTLEIGPRGQFALAANGAPLDQNGFLGLLSKGMQEEHQGIGSREISAEVLHITVVP
ncbi:hypothetical protein [uncultured Roseobacter sp.]|uniref:hypothetical protein n=1 Tax=uncultured Roseobacter sp. TaxID=114847 RepID=UPI00262AAFA2|nr:hypothetical protein [uncultured Roseobacter sp.]